MINTRFTTKPTLYFSYKRFRWVWLQRVSAPL